MSSNKHSSCHTQPAQIMKSNATKPEHDLSALPQHIMSLPSIGNEYLYPQGQLSGCGPRPSKGSVMAPSSVLHKSTWVCMFGTRDTHAGREHKESERRHLCRIHVEGQRLARGHSYQQHHHHHPNSCPPRHFEMIFSKKKFSRLCNPCATTNSSSWAPGLI